LFLKTRIADGFVFLRISSIWRFKVAIRVLMAFWSTLISLP